MLNNDPRLDTIQRFGRAMADTTRSQILLTLLDAPTSPSQLSDDLGLTRSNVSNHLRCLQECGIVKKQMKGRTAQYSIAEAHIAHALRELLSVELETESDATCLPVHTK